MASRCRTCLLLYRYKRAVWSPATSLPFPLSKMLQANASHRPPSDFYDALATDMCRDPAPAGTVLLVPSYSLSAAVCIVACCLLGFNWMAGSRERPEGVRAGTLTLLAYGSL